MEAAHLSDIEERLAYKLQGGGADHGLDQR